MTGVTELLPIKSDVVVIYFKNSKCCLISWWCRISNLPSGCKVVISSRNIERLQAAAQEMRQKILASSPASVTPLQCNIRNENEVQIPSHSASWTPLFSLYNDPLSLHECLCEAGQGPCVVCAEAARQDRLPGQQWRRSVLEPSGEHVFKRLEGCDWYQPDWNVSLLPGW